MALKRIRFLVDTYGKSEGDTATIRLETEGEIYYYDCFRRWCYVYKTEEGTTFEYIKQRKNNIKAQIGGKEDETR